MSSGGVNKIEIIILWNFLKNFFILLFVVPRPQMSVEKNVNK